MAAAVSQLDLVVRGARVLTDDGISPSSVAVRDGQVVAVGPETAGWTARRVISLADDEVLLPGLVDTHVHINEPGRTKWEGFATATRAAAAGGVTALIDMPLNCIPPTVDVGALQAKRSAAAGQCYVDVGFWGGVIPGNVPALRPLYEAGVYGFKCFLVDSGVEEFPPLDREGLEIAIAELAALDALLIVHAEDAAVIQAAPDCEGTSYAAFLRSRPPAAEQEAIRAIVELARTHGARAHVVHLSSADGLSDIGQARMDGVRVSVETCPHYLTLTAEQISDGETQFKCCPPIREAANRERLWDGLRAGVIDCVVSDHSPCPPDLKSFDDGVFARAWGGVSSLELGLPVVWTEARERGFGLTDLARWMASGPAEIARIDTKGHIGVGCDADFVIFAPEASFVVDAHRLHHRHPVTPYEGRELVGAVRSSWLRGVEITDGHPTGRQLNRGGS
jgi:allantoinase